MPKPAPAPHLEPQQTPFAELQQRCGEQVVARSRAGSLTAAEVGCLDGFLATNTGPERLRGSLLLIANDGANDNRERWEERITWHLTEIDDSDPNLAYQLALDLYDQGIARRAEVNRWADLALAHRAAWSGETYKTHVAGLYKLRAASSQSLWQIAEETRERYDTPTAMEDASAARLFAWGCARDWYTFLEASGADPTRARELCQLAGGPQACTNAQ